jgi:MFS family permease
MVENLGTSAGMVGALAAVSTLAALPGQRLFGIWTDRVGPRRVQLITGLTIPLVPWAWAMTRSPWHLIPVNLVAGFLWAGYGVASFSMLLSLAPEDQRSRDTALYQILVTLGLAAGSAIGGFVATRWGLVSVFVLSGFGRLLGALIFGRLVKDAGANISKPRSRRRVRRRRLGTV